MTTLDDSGLGAAVVLDTPWRHLADVEAALRGLDVGEAGHVEWVCTHMVREPKPHYTLAIVSTDVETIAGALGLAVASGATAATTRAEVVARDGGRAARFPGQPDVGGDVPVHELLARTAIDEVERIDGGPVAASDVIETRDFLRPLFREGRLVLPVLPAGDGRVAPFEVPNPTPCCGGR